MMRTKLMTVAVAAVLLLTGISVLSAAGPANEPSSAAEVRYGGLEKTPEMLAIEQEMEERAMAQQEAEAALAASGVNLYALDDKTLSGLGENYTEYMASSASSASVGSNGTGAASFRGLVQAQQLLTTYRWDVRWTYYSHRDLMYQPCKKVFTELRDSTYTVVQTANTNADGWVTYYVTPGTYYVLAYVDDHLTNKVATTSGSVYVGSTGPCSITADTYHPSHRFLSGNSCCRPFDWFLTIQTGWDWLKANTPSPGWGCPSVTAYWPVGESGSTHTHMGFNSCFIDVPSANEADLTSRTVPLHEWAHAVHYWARGGNAPSGFDGARTHGLWTEATTGSGRNWEFAFVEGWAIFLPCAVYGTATNMYPGYGDLEYGGDSALTETYPDGTGKVYADCTRAGGNTGDWDGWDCEGAVAACLWDIYDGTSTTDRPSWSPVDYRDGQGPWFPCVWHVFKDHQPANMYGMYTQLNSDYPLPNYWWYNTFYNARMNGNNPYSDS